MHDYVKKALWRIYKKFKRTPFHAIHMQLNVRKHFINMHFSIFLESILYWYHLWTQVALINYISWHELRMNNKSNQIKSLLLSHHHSTSALVSEILTSVLQTVQKNKTTIYIWTVHIYRLYRRQCAKYTYIYSVHIVYYKDILRYQCTNTHYTLYVHVCIMSTSMHSNMWRCDRL